MATPSEIIMSRDRRRLPVSERIHNVVDTTGGLTDELYNTEIMRTLGKTAPAYLDESEWETEPKVPDLKSVLSKLGVKVEDDPTGVKAARKFVEEFPKKREAWKSKIEKDPSFGTRGWNTVQDLFKQTATDLMNYDIAENRRKAVHGLNEKGEIEDPGQWAWSKIATLFTPRSLKAYEAGREPTTSEILRDVGANAMYALPFGTGAKALTVGAPAAIKAVANLGSQAIAPAAVSIMDVASDPDYTGDEAVTDALIGTAANLGINKFLAPLIAGKMATSQGAITRGPFMRSVKEVLEDMPTLSEKAKETVKGAYTVLGDATASSAEKAAASDILEAASALGKGNPLRGVAEQAVGDAAYVAKELAKSNKQALKASGLPVSTRGYDPARAVGQALDNATREAGGAVQYSKVLAQHPELVGLVKNDLARQLASPSNILKVYSVNLAGNNSPEAAMTAGNMMGLDVKAITKKKEETKKERQASKVSDVLGKSGRSDLTDEDEKYLRRISENPKILKFSQDDGFKTWLLKRGHQLLQGTPAHRPLWEVE